MLKRILIGVAGVLVLAIGGLAVFLATLDIEAYRPRILAAAEAATGRRVTIGAMRLGLGLTPRVEVRDAALGNLPGGSRENMVSVGRAELQLKLLPLISGRIALHRLVLERPEIVLEVVGGEPNWRFTTPASPGTAQAPATPAAERSSTAPIELGTVEIRDASLIFPGAPQGGVSLRRLQASGEGNLSAEGELLWGQEPVSFSLSGGSLARAMGQPGGAWPVTGRVEAGGARVSLRGEMREPRGLQDYRLEIEAEVPDLRRLSPLAGVTLPPVNGITLRGRVSGSGTTLPRAEGINLSVAGAEPAPGVILRKLEIAMPAMDQPLRLVLEGTRDGQALTLTGTMGPLGPVLSGGALPLELAGEHMGQRLRLAGQVAKPLTGEGVALDLRLESSTAGTFSARLSERGAMFAEGVQLTTLRAEGPALAGEGELSLLRSTPPRLEGQITLSRLDVDAMRASLAPAPTGASARPAPQASAAAPVPSDGRMIPDMPVDLSFLKLAQAELRFAVAVLRANGREYRDVQGGLQLANARLRIDPLGITLPGGRLALRLAADDAGEVPALQLSVRSDAVEVGPMLGAFGIAAPVTGHADIDVELRGSGRTTRTIAAGAVGHVGLALVNGQVRAATVRNSLPQNLHGAVPEEVGIACLAARFDVVAGIAQSRTFFIDSGLGKVAGQGQISLRDESLSMRLNTDLRLPVPGVSGGLRVRAPVPMGGTLANPRFDTTAMIGSAASSQIGQQADRLAPGLGAIAGQLLGGAQQGGAATPAMPGCAQALPVARGGRAGTIPASQAPADAPAQQTAPAQQQQQRVPQVQDLLRGFLGR